MPPKSISVKQARYYWTVYLYVLPSLVLLLTFAYFPAWSAIYHSFFKWNGGDISVFVGFDNYVRAFTDPVLGYGFMVIGILVSANLIKMIPSIVTAVVIHRLKSDKWAYLYRVLFVIPMIIPSIVWLLVWKYFFDPTFGILNKLLSMTGLMWVLQKIDSLFGWEIFIEGLNPAWLSQSELIVPSLILWGFPWVGIVGVLIYLAGLSAISQDVYDSVKIDGAGWLRKFFSIEFPLIMTQVRLNLVLMIIGTLQDYGLVLILLGDAGGTGGAAMVPGLYMFRNAFVGQQAGYACAIGLLLFVIILALTLISNKYVKIDK